MSDPSSRPSIVAQEDLVIDVQFLLQDVMSQKNLSRADVARMTGFSERRLSNLMKSGANPTLRQVAYLLHCMGERMIVGCASKLAAKPQQE